jgi:hypothetical protein
LIVIKYEQCLRLTREACPAKQLRDAATSLLG